MNVNDLKIGIVDAGIRHASLNPPPSIEEKFRLVRDAAVFDYIDVTPLAHDVSEYQRCSQQYGIKILAGSCNYTLGKDEEKLAENLRIGSQLGSIVHNTQIFMDHSDGYLVSNEEVMKVYLNAYDLGERLGCRPTLEVHVNMWSEKFTRVWEVAQMVQTRGVPFRMTLDHSHVIFKVDNPIEQSVFGLDKLIDSGDLVIDPALEGNVLKQWISSNLVGHAHARSVAANNPKNKWAAHPDITNLRSSLHPMSVIGRGIQYPFIEPAKGEWHSEWRHSDLEPWKSVMKMLMHHHAHDPRSELETISTEFIPFTDYGQGSHYSLLENNTACAIWLRDTWQQIVTDAGTLTK